MNRRLWLEVETIHQVANRSMDRKNENAIRTESKSLGEIRKGNEVLAKFDSVGVGVGT